MILDLKKRFKSIIIKRTKYQKIMLVNQNNISVRKNMNMIFQFQ